MTPARRRIGLDSKGRDVAPTALNVVRSGRQPIQLLIPREVEPTELLRDWRSSSLGRFRVPGKSAGKNKKPDKKLGHRGRHSDLSPNQVDGGDSCCV